MVRTSPVVTFGLFDLDVKADATITASDEQTFSKAADLETGNVVTLPLISYEPDYWLLDGNWKIKPVDDDDVHAGIISLSQSDATGAFAVAPEMTIELSTAHDIEGLNIRFSQISNDYCNDIDVIYYNTSDVVIRADNYNPSSWEFSTDTPVSGVKKVVIIFYTTNKPYRFLRITGVDFGTLITFSAGAIKSASIVEQVNPLSTELPIGVFDLSLFSSNSAFSIINPAGDYAALEERQPLDAYESIDGSQIYMGRYYLDNWENPSDTQVIFRCIDALGILDTIPYVGGIWTSPTTASDLIDEIMTLANIPYDLDPSLESVEVKGWIPFTNCRAALQQIAFAIGAYVTCSRSSLIKIYPTVLASDATEYAGSITRAEKAASEQSLTLKTLITGVSVTAHNYVANTTVRTLYNGTLTAGTHTIKFSAPAHTLNITGATISASGANYATVTVATTGTVTLTGRGYDDTTSITTIETAGLSTNVRKKLVEIQQATLVHPGNVATIAQRIYDYYQQRYLQKVKTFASLIQPGSTVTVETLYDRELAGTIEKLTTNLSGGFVNRAEITGVILDE